MDAKWSSDENLPETTHPGSARPRRPPIPTASSQENGASSLSPENGLSSSGIENRTNLSTSSSSLSSSTSMVKKKTSLKTLTRMANMALGLGTLKSKADTVQKNESQNKEPSQPADMTSSPPSASGLLPAYSFRKENKYQAVTDGLKSLYKKTLKPLEDISLFNEFHGTKMDEAADFDAVPMVLIIGQYSTGKSTFLKYILGEDYPGINIGPEPTTDKFTVIMHGADKRIMPGNAVVLDAKMPFRTLSKFGNSFLNRMQCSTMDSPLLKGLGLIDTPGVLAGQKQKTERGYDFTAVLTWFAARVDRILLLFDAHKLDISDELRSVISAIKPYDEKLRIILNKSDSIDTPQLIRVHGALMWSLGKALECPEVCKVYMGSFWDRPLVNDGLREIFDADQEALTRDLKQMPQMAALRKLNDFSKRARLVMMHAIILNEVLARCPFFTFKKVENRNKVIDGLEDIYSQLEGKYGECSGDYPSIQVFKEKLRKIEWSRLKRIDEKIIARIPAMLEREMSKLVAQANEIDKNGKEPTPTPKPRKWSKTSPTSTTASGRKEPTASCGSFHGPLDIDERETPFRQTTNIDLHVWSDEYRLGGWIVASEDPIKFKEWVRTFESLNTIDGKLTGAAAKSIMLESKLQESTLRKIWKLSDVTGDQVLDKWEFCLAMYLIDHVVDKDQELPASLPDFLHPEKHRHFRP